AGTEHPRDPDVVRAKALARARPTGPSRANQARRAHAVAGHSVVSAGRTGPDDKARLRATAVHN
ncbi:MAG: hypothetical protein ACRDS0_32445, partial [Pseudonocardiaceae bacterium]